MEALFAYEKNLSVSHFLLQTAMLGHCAAWNLEYAIAPRNQNLFCIQDKYQSSNKYVEYQSIAMQTVFFVNHRYVYSGSYSWVSKIHDTHSLLIEVAQNS